MPPIGPIPVTTPLHFPVSGLDLVSMIVNMLKMTGGEHTYDKIATHPVIKMGNELALGRYLTEDEYKVLLTTPNSALQKATNIKYFYFQILEEIVKIHEEFVIENIRLAESAMRFKYLIEAAEQEKDEKIKQMSAENEQDKLAQEKKIIDKYLADIAPMQSYIAAIKVAQTDMLAIDKKLDILSNNVVAALNIRTKRIVEIYKTTHQTLIKEVEREVAVFDKVLDTLESRLAAAEKDLKEYAAGVASQDDSGLRERKESVDQLRKQIKGINTISTLNKNYINDETSHFERTTDFCLNCEEKLQTVLRKEDIPPPLFQAGMNGVLLEFTTTIGRKIRSDFNYHQVMEETSKNPAIIAALGKIPAQISAPEFDRSTFDALIKESNAEIQEFRAQIKSIKSDHEKIHHAIVEQQTALEKQSEQMPVTSSRKVKNKLMPKKNREPQSLVSHMGIHHERETAHHVKTHPNSMNQSTPVDTKTGKPKLSENILPRPTGPKVGR